MLKGTIHLIGRRFEFLPGIDICLLICTVSRSCSPGNESSFRYFLVYDGFSIMALAQGKFCSSRLRIAGNLRLAALISFSLA